MPRRECGFGDVADDRINRRLGAEHEDESRSLGIGSNLAHQRGDLVRSRTVVEAPLNSAVPRQATKDGSMSRLEEAVIANYRDSIPFYEQ